MPKTVDEIIKEHPRTTFYIGSRSGFFFIGDYTEWKKRKDLVNGACMRKYDSAQYEARSNVPDLLKDITKLVTDRRINRNACSKKIADLMHYVEDMAVEWENIGNRVPVKIDKKSIDDGIALIVKGLELGGFWLKEEYDRCYRRDV